MLVAVPTAAIGFVGGFIVAAVEEDEVGRCVSRRGNGNWDTWEDMDEKE